MSHLALVALALALTPDPDVLVPDRTLTEVTGTVFADRDGDGIFTAADEPLAGVVVGWEHWLLSEPTAADGSFTLAVPYGGILWVRVPDGFSPEPVWTVIPGDGEAVSVELGLTPRPLADPTTFVHVSDLHLGTIDAGIARHALAQAAPAGLEAAFLVVTGDLSSSAVYDGFDGVVEAFRDVTVPIVPVAGNHDWDDGGPQYRALFGPPMYSFDAGGAHFVVLNFNAPWNEQLAFVQADLALTDPGRTVVGFTHAPLANELADELVAAGVDYLFSGHFHTNRVIDHGGMLEVNTQTLAIGGGDYTPAGFRVVELGGGGLTMWHHTVVDTPVARVVSPGPDEVLEAPPANVIAAIEVGAAAVAVTVSVDGGPPIPMAPRGGWAYEAALPALAPGAHALALTVTVAGGAPLRQTSWFRVRGGDAPGPLELADWPQLQGSAEHRGAQEREIRPPLGTVWARAVGGHLRGGAPAVADGRVFVPVLDLAEARRGGVVALDLATGELLWEDRAGQPVHNAPAVADGLVVFARADGVVAADRAATGEPVWRTHLDSRGERYATWLYAAPTIDDGVVYIGGEQRLVALELATGAILWYRPIESETIMLSNYAAAAVGEGVLLAALGWDNNQLAALGTGGDEHWRLTGRIQATPVVERSVSYLADAAGSVRAVSLHTGEELWRTGLYDTTIRLGLTPFGTPALAEGRLFVPTPNRLLYALDAATGSPLWRVAAEPTIIRPFPYAFPRERAFTASPVVTGGLVWIGGADGRLRALDAADGTPRWERDLGVPILSAVVPAGDLLIVASYDGTVRAMRTLVVDEGEPAVDPGACGCRAAGRGGWAGAGWLGVLVAVASRRGRRRSLVA